MARSWRSLMTLRRRIAVTLHILQGDPIFKTREAECGGGKKEWGILRDMGNARGLTEKGSHPRGVCP